MAHCTTHIQYPRRIETGVILLDPGCSAVTHVRVVRSHLPHRVDKDGPVIDRAGGNVAFGHFGMVATRLAMDIHRPMVTRHLQTGVEPQAAACASRCLCLIHQFMQLSLHGLLRSGPHHFLAGAQQCAEHTVMRVPGHHLAHFKAISRVTPVLLGE